MKIKRSTILTQRKIVEKRLKDWAVLGTSLRPPAGWIKAIRGALGMTTQQLADRMGSDQSGVVRIETREAEGKVTLETLEKAARAMNCKLVYALVPDQKYSGSVEEIVKERAIILAQSLLASAGHSMALEAQRVAKDETDEQVMRLAREFLQEGDSRLWREK